MDVEHIQVAADSVIDFISRLGIDTLHNYPGGTIAPLLDACVRFGIRVITSRHEQGAGYAAIAQAKITGLPGVVAVTSGPGVTNVMTSVADAYFDSIPLLVFTGQVGTGDLRGQTGLRQKGFQEIDTPQLMKAITKQQFQPTTVDALLAAMPQAWESAMSGRPGPVSIDIPMNIQRSPCTEVIAVSPTRLEDTAQRPSDDADFFDALMMAIKAAHRPVIIVGQGMLHNDLYEQLRKLVDYWPAPVSHSLLGIGALDSAAALNLSFHGHTGSQVAGKAIASSDCILVLGSRLDVRQVGSETQSFGPDAKIFRIDFDRHELEHSRITADYSLNCSLEYALPKLIERIKGRLPSLPSLSDWHAHIETLRQSYGWSYETYPGISPITVIEQLSEALSTPVICVTGVGAHQHWVARHFRFCLPERQFFTSAGHGAMGYDLPTAIGAAFHAPDKQILCIVGDGSFQMNIQELGVITEFKLNIKIVVLDNQRLGLVSQFQLMNWPQDTACGNKHSPDFYAIAQAYGLAAFRAREVTELNDNLPKFIEHPGAALFHIKIDSRHDVSPMMMGGQPLDKMWPYYDLKGNAQ